MRTLMDDSSLSSRRKKKQAGIFLKRKAYNLWFAVVVVGAVECGKRAKTLAIKGKAFPQTFHSIFSFSTASEKDM